MMHEPTTTTRKVVTLRRLQELWSSGEKIAMLTCYDAAFARLLDEAGVDVLLVGDSLGMTIQGHASTLPVSMEDMEYHTRLVAHGNRTAWVIADMPFGSYQESPEQAIRNATRLMKAGAHMVKIEGGNWTQAAVRAVVERGIPVCAHLGLTPQSVFSLGGYRIQGKDESSASIMRRQAHELAAAGATMLVIELTPTALAREITSTLPIPTIGIGAGSGCSGQVLVLYDMLGVSRGKQPRFVRNFAAEGADIGAAVRAYVAAVKAGRFPDDALHGY